MLAAPLATILAAVSCAGQPANLSDWPHLIDKNDSKAARTLCSAYLDSKDVAQRVEAQKCLANVALCGNDITVIGEEKGTVSMRPGYKSQAAVDEALIHLNIGLKLAPQDLSIHKGRLHVLETDGRYSAMVKALDESCAIYKGKDAPDTWLAYAVELSGLREYKAALEFNKVLDRHYPNSPDVVGNVGAFLSMLDRSAEAIPYLKKAVSLAPKDAINVWNLARAYDDTNQVQLANKWFLEGLLLQTDPSQRKKSSCFYAQFIEKKLHERPRACSMEKGDCSSEERTACGPVPDTPTSKK
jgi:tetratricopeptide (TPR) repeat protein